MNLKLIHAVIGLAVCAASGASVGPRVVPLATAPTPRSCVAPALGDAAARGAGNPRSGDHRAMTIAEQRRIDARTARILAGRRASSTTTPVTVPVYVHEMTSRTGAGTVSDARIARQIEVLNQTYSGLDADHPGGPDTGFRFRLAARDRIANDLWHHDGDSTTYRAKTRKGVPGALNIWLVDFDYLGIATFPWDFAAAPSIDGIRIEFKSLPGGSATHYNEGKTATHEAGHWLGLFHTFQNGCASPGDEVLDTAAQASPSTGCPLGRDSCTARGSDPIHNYLDYSYDSCYQSFTAGQIVRMKQMWSAYRAPR